MLSHFAALDKFTFPFVIKACTIPNSITIGKQVHGLAIKTGFYRDTYFHNTMIDFYCKCGDWECERKPFDKMHARPAKQSPRRLVSEESTPTLKSNGRSRRFSDEMKIAILLAPIYSENRKRGTSNLGTTISARLLKPYLFCRQNLVTIICFNIKWFI
ncbi:hypothetical protein Scep_030136 [Stephania cephalantha]|uniref:Uncharacterized protein n=1 Tax=Stephania cephalantha TaxID=152367 RepID=A0AAP0DYZ3_9MAGN